jgi:hypothetical protein
LATSLASGLVVAATSLIKKPVFRLPFIVSTFKTGDVRKKKLFREVRQKIDPHSPRKNNTEGTRKNDRLKIKIKRKVVKGTNRLNRSNKE